MGFSKSPNKIKREREEAHERRQIVTFFSKMTLCRAYPFFVLACLCIGILVARIFGVSLLVGVIAGWAVGIVPLVALVVLYFGIMWWRPDLPPCRCGETKNGGFEYLGCHSQNPEETWYENRCPKCGRRYKSSGTVVLEILSEGTCTPFMKQSRWGFWEVDHSEHPESRLSGVGQEMDLLN